MWTERKRERRERKKGRKQEREKADKQTGRKTLTPTNRHAYGLKQGKVSRETFFISLDRLV